MSMMTTLLPIHNFTGTRDARRLGAAIVGLADGIAVPDLRIDESVEQIRQQVRRAIDRRDDKDATLNERQVVPLEREYHHAAEARIGKHGLDHHDAADEPADID